MLRCLRRCRVPLVVVESPTKARTIGRYLGEGYRVAATVGHLRELPRKWGSVKPDDDFAMTFQLKEGAARRVQELVQVAKDCSAVYLATDPDREGEAIAWHIQEVLVDALSESGTVSPPFHRVAFHEVTPAAVQTALERPRPLDSPLVDAQQARQALDFLVGFSLSPLLWKKLEGCSSAGRVQSATLRLLCDREVEVNGFVQSVSWAVEGSIEAPNTIEKASPTGGNSVKVDVVTAGGRTLRKGSVASKEDGDAVAAQVLQDKTFRVSKVVPKRVKYTPRPPLTTSELQQAASSELGFSPEYTMRLAQRLFEGAPVADNLTKGVITYMRTDSTTLSPAFQKTCGEYIEQYYGVNYRPRTPPTYKQKSNSQEAHEAIRPTNINWTPETEGFLEGEPELHALYRLIWVRTLQSQMKPMEMDQYTVFLDNTAGGVTLKGSVTYEVFDGYTHLKVGGASIRKDTTSTMVWVPKEGEAVTLLECSAVQHKTRAPSRYTEATLIKAMEAHGIGRPSTYAITLKTLHDRNYAVNKGNRLLPTPQGESVVQFLKDEFPSVVDSDFTRQTEESLDLIAAGTLQRVAFLHGFWSTFYPHVGFVRAGLQGQLRSLGVDDTTNLNVWVRDGPYGWYVQIGQDNPTRVKLPAQCTPATVTLEEIQDKVCRPIGAALAQCGSPVVAVLKGRGYYFKAGGRTLQPVEGVPYSTVDGKRLATAVPGVLTLL